MTRVDLILAKQQDDITFNEYFRLNNSAEAPVITQRNEEPPKKLLKDQVKLHWI